MVTTVERRFESFVLMARETQATGLGRAVPTIDCRILALDPGGTTGFAVFEGFKLTECGQLITSTVKDGAPILVDFVKRVDPTYVVIEDYRIYRSKAKEHVGADLVTVRLIGVIETLCFGCLDSTLNFQLFKQPAHIAKQFMDDKKLKKFRLWQTNQRHANDAIRHGCYFILFGGKPQ